MPEYLAPGVYVEEVDTGSKPIEGVSTSTSGMVGVTEWGPVNVPVLVTGVADYRRQFGWYLDRRVFVNDTWYLPHAVKGFFDNGGKRLYVVRVLPEGPTGATSARATMFGAAATALTTRLAGRAEQGEGLLLVDDTTGVSPGEALLLTDGSSSEYVEAAGDVLALAAPVAAAHAAATATTPSPVVGYGDDATPREMTTADASPGDTTIDLDDVTGLAPAGGDILLIDTGGQVELVTTTLVAANTVTFQPALQFAHALATPTAVSRLDPTNVIGSTPLVSELSAGDYLLVVEDETQLTGSLAVGFGGPPSTDFQPLGDVGAVAAVTQLSFNQNAGTPVAIPSFTSAAATTLTADATAGEDEQLTLSDRAGLVAGSILRLGAPGNLEFVIVETTPGAGPGVVSLRSAVRLNHANGDSVTPLTDNDTDTSPTGLARDANPGESGLVLANASGYAPGAVVRVGESTSNTVEYHELTATSIGLLGLARPLADSHAAGLELSRRAQSLEVQAIDPGGWGNALRVVAEDDTPILETRPTPPGGGAGEPTLRLNSIVGIEQGTVLEFYRIVAGVFTSVFTQKVAGVLANNRVSFAGGLAQAVTADMRVRTREFRLTTYLSRLNPVTLREEPVPGHSETLRQLSLDPRHSRYVVRIAGPITPTITNPLRADGRTDGESDWIRVEDVLTAAQAEAAVRVGLDVIRETLPSGRTQIIPRPLAGGDDAIGSVTDGTYIGDDAHDPDDRTGLYALKNIEEVSIVAVPGRTSQLVQQELITHCELMRYRFAVLDSVEGDGVGDVQEQRGLYDTKYAALYYPWLRITDPFPDNPRLPGRVSIPPSGHVVGIYARSDIERGVHKAPANEVIRNIADLEFKLTKEEQDILNPRNINVLRDFRDNNRGLRVWGARCVTSDPDWKYVNVRRLFIFVEHSIDRGTQWVVFEPNSEALWERVRRTVSAFLRNVWRDGALMGRTPEEAYFVKVDRTTMTQNDIDNGRLIVLVGIAPVKPAEFVIFRIGQWAGGSELEEG